MARSPDFLLSYPDFRRLRPLRVKEDVGRDQDQQFVILFLLATLPCQDVEAWDTGEQRQTVQALFIRLRDHSRYGRLFPVLEQDSTLILAIQNVRNAICNSGSQCAEFHVQLERNVGIVVHQRFRLECEPDVFIID